MYEEILDEGDVLPSHGVSPPRFSLPVTHANKPSLLSSGILSTSRDYETHQSNLSPQGLAISPHGVTTRSQPTSIAFLSRQKEAKNIFRKSPNKLMLKICERD